MKEHTTGPQPGRVGRFLEHPINTQGFLEMRDELVEEPPTAEELTALLEHIESWSPRIKRPTPLAWLWRSSRGIECPELGLCNAILPKYLGPTPGGHPTHHREDDHVDHSYDPYEESYADLLDQDSAEAEMHLALNAGSAPEHTFDPRVPEDV